MMIVTTATIFLAVLCAKATSTDANQWSRDLEQRLRQQLAPLENLGSKIQSTINENLNSLPNFSPPILQMEENLPQRDLGAFIRDKVYQGLRPVREMESKMRIKFGQNGITIATFKDRKYLIRNGILYKCDGTLSEQDGRCSGTLQRATFNKKEDFCYAHINSMINNWYCLGTGNSINSGSINGNVYCKSFDNSPTLLISANEYRNLCGDKNNPVHYKYFTNVPMGEYGPDVQCYDNKQSIVCTMNDSQNAGSYSTYNSAINFSK